jgi:putative phage-type endonuclease
MERDEWLAARRLCITGTDIAAILGVHPYVSAADVWATKLGLQEEAEENEIMYWGKRLERTVAEEWFKRRDFGAGARLREGQWTHSDHPAGLRMGGTPDFDVEIDGNVIANLECKTASAFAGGWGFGEQNFPTQYYCQCQWYLMLTGSKLWNLAVLIGGNDFRDYVIPPHPQLQKIMVERASLFWRDYVLTKRPPPPDSSACYRRAVGILLPNKAEPMLAPPELGEVATELAEAKLQAKVLDAQINKLQNQLVEKAAELQSDTILGENWKFSYRECSGRKTTDYKKVFQDFGITSDMLKDYERVGKPYRVAKFNYEGVEE